MGLGGNTHSAEACALLLEHGDGARAVIDAIFTAALAGELVLAQPARLHGGTTFLAFVDWAQGAASLAGCPRHNLAAVTEAGALGAPR